MNDNKMEQSPAPKTADRIEVPKGDVLLRRIAGPDGNHAKLGRVKRGRIYTVQFELAVKLTTGDSPEFEAVYPDVAKDLKAARAKSEKESKG